MKHNKKRNTAFLYECLIKELTKAIVREDKKRQKITKNILKRILLAKEAILKKELELYNSILESKALRSLTSPRGYLKKQK
jgi:TATA-binding protein-associated factor Taf7